MKLTTEHAGPARRHFSVGLPSLVFALLFGLMLAGPSSTLAQTPPDKLTRSNLHDFDAESEIIEGNFPGLLLIPNRRPDYHDEKYGEPYHLACHVYTAVPSAGTGSEI